MSFRFNTNIEIKSNDGTRSPTGQQLQINEIKRAIFEIAPNGVYENEDKQMQREVDVREVLDYDDLSNYAKYQIGEDETDRRKETYQKYLKMLQRRVIVKMERKNAKANLKAEILQKQKLQSQLNHLIELEQGQKLNKLQSKLQQLKIQVKLQEQLKQSLLSQLLTLQAVNTFSQQQINQFPVQMGSYVQLMQAGKQGIVSTNQKIAQLINLQDVLLDNLQQIISQFPGI